MRYVKDFLFIVIFAIFASLAVGVNYVMPSYRTAYVTGIEVKRMDKDGLISKSNVADGPTRDVYFIYTHAPDNDSSVKVYRDEDTRWGFPFYFKFNSADVAAMAQSLEGDHLVQVKYYGWRIKIFDTYPNIVSIKPIMKAEEVSSPIVSYILYILILIGFIVSIQFVRGWFDSHQKTHQK